MRGNAVEVRAEEVSAWRLRIYGGAGKAISRAEYLLSGQGRTGPANPLGGSGRREHANRRQRERYYGRAVGDRRGDSSISSPRCPLRPDKAYSIRTLSTTMMTPLL